MMSEVFRRAIEMAGNGLGWEDISARLTAVGLVHSRGDIRRLVLRLRSCPIRKIAP